MSSLKGNHRFFKSIFNSIVASICLLLCLVTFSQFLDSLAPIYLEAASSSQSQSLLKKSSSSQKIAADKQAKNDKRYRQVEFDNSSSNCINPIGYEEDVTKKTETTKYYWVPKNKDVPRNLTRSSNPEYFTTVVCSYSSKVNYKDTDGKFKIIDNTLKNIDKKDLVVPSKQNGSQSSSNSLKNNELIKSYAYTNTGNDFKVYFSSNPNNGFWFIAPDGTELKVTNVSIAGKGLYFDNKLENKNNQVGATKLDANSITYNDVLPNIDLQYRVDNEGVSKYFILKNKESVKNDLSKIEFTIDSGDSKLIKKNAINEDLNKATDFQNNTTNNTKLNKDLDAKLTDSNSKNTANSNNSSNNNQLQTTAITTEEVQAKMNTQNEAKKTIDNALNSASSEIKQAVSDIQSGDANRVANADKLSEDKKKQVIEQLQKSNQSALLKERNDKLAELKKEIEVKGNKSSEKQNAKDQQDQEKIKDEVIKILETANPSDEIILTGKDGKTSEVNKSLKLGTPYSYEVGNKNTESKFVEAGVKPDTFKISEDGKTFTIYPDTSYLNSNDRQFPIIIDPRLIGGNYTAADAFYNSYAPNSARGSNNAFHLLVGGNPCINVGTSSCAWMGNSRTAITFNIPAEVQSASNVVWANFRLRQYSSNGGGFRMKVNNACGFNEGGVTWYSQPCIAEDIGYMDVGNTNCGGAGCGGDSWSTDIGDLLRRNLNGGGRNVHLVLRDDNEGSNRGAAFCSKDGWNSWHPCNNGTNQGPYLQVYINERPSSPNAELPDNGDYLGKCDKSVIPNTGNCNSKLTVDYKISNINDGDGDQDCTSANVRIVNRNSIFNSNWAEFWGPANRGCPDTGDLSRTYNIPTSNGRFDWAAINRDNYGLESSYWSNTRKFSVDTSPPVKVGSLNLPEFSRGDKLNFSADSYGDNLLNKYTINASGNAENTNYIKFNSGSSTLVLGQNGTNLELVTATNNNTQKWYLSGYQFKLESSNRSQCLDAVNIKDSLVTLVNCVSGGNSNQNWILNQNGQLALKDKQELCLSTQAGAITIGTKLVVNTCAPNQFNQRFEIVKLTDVSRRLDVNNGGGNASDNIHLFQPHDGTNQMWTLESSGKIRSVQGKCLSIVDTNANSRVNYWDCVEDSNLYQKWEYTAKKELKNVGGNSCLDIMGGNGNSNGIILFVATCNDNFNQKWNITKVEDSKIYAKLKQDDNGIGDVFFLKMYGGKDFTGNCINPGCNIHIWDHTGNLNQRLIYTKDFEIKPVENQSVCADAASINNGGNVYWWSCHGGENQKWVFDGVSGAIKTRANQNFCIDRNGLAPDNGSNITLWDCNYGRNQQWKIEFENGKQPQNSLEYPNQQLQYNTQLLKTNDPKIDTDYYYPEIKNAFQGSPNFQFPNGNQTGTIPETDLWLRVRTRDRSQDANTNISEFTTPTKVTIDNTRPSINNFGITGNRVFSTIQNISPATNTTTNPPTPLTIKFDVTEKNFRNAQVNVLADFSVLAYQNNYQDIAGNASEATRIISQDKGLITQTLWNNSLYQVKSLDNKIYTRNYREPSGFSDWQQANLETNEVVAGSKKLVNTSDSVSMTVFQNKLWQFIRTTNTGSNTVETSGIFYRNTADGLNWSNWIRIEGAISSEPAVVSFNNKLLVYVRGTDNQIYQKYFDGTNWTNWTANGQYTLAKPAVTIFNNKVYQSFLANSNKLILIRDSIDGLSWSAIRDNGGQTPGEISLVTFNGKLLQSVRSLSTNPANFTNICNRYSLDGSSFSNWTCDSRLTNQTITFQKYGNLLYSSIISNDGKIYTKNTSDGIAWTEWSLLNSSNNSNGNSTEIVPMGIKVLDILTSCTSNLNIVNQNPNTTLPCNYLNFSSDLSSSKTFTFNYTPPNSLPEGKYELKPIVFDRTCSGNFYPSNYLINNNSNSNNTNQLDTLDSCNLAVGEGLDNFIRVDNSPAKIGISSPFDGAWVSNPNFKINGGVGGFNQTGCEGVVPATSCNISNSSNSNNSASSSISNSNSSIFQLPSKEDKDVAKFYFCKAVNTATDCIDENNTAQDKTSSLNSLKNFSLETNLSLGANYYRFRTKDSIGNPNSKIGTENSNSLKDYWTLNYDNLVPFFNKIELKNPTTNTITNLSSSQINPANYDTFPGSNSSNQNLSFRFKDNDSNLSAVSGFEAFIDSAGNTSNITGNTYKLTPVTNPKNFTISLTRDIDGSGFKEIPLYRDGVNVTNSTDDPRLTKELTCTPEAIAINSYINCSTDLNNLKLDGIYRVFIKIQDRAGNQACNTQYDELDANFSCKFANSSNNSNFNIQSTSNANNQALRPEFKIQTITYLEAQSPKEAVNTTYSNVEFKGKSQKGNTISIFNDKLNRVIEFKNDLSDNQSLPREFSVTNGVRTLTANKDVTTGRVFSSNTSKLTIECGGNFVDHDKLSETKEIEYCSYTITLNQLANTVVTSTNTTSSAIAPIENTNTVTTIDSFNNTLSKAVKVIIDINNLNLASTPDYTAISPNGDGKFDKTIFTNLATIKDPTNSSKVIDFTGVTSYVAKITNVNNQIVWQKSDGIVGGKLPATFEFDGSYNSNQIPDGQYSYILSLTRTINNNPVSITTKPITISIKRNITGNVVITSPSSSTEYTTTRGVINIQGELPKSNDNDLWKVNLCFKLIDANNILSKDCVINSSVNGVKGDGTKILGYLKPITITNSTTANTTLNNYQVKLIVDTKTLIDGKKMRADCNDLRIKDTDQSTDLPYWIEKGCNTAQTTIWTKIPSLLPGSKTIYLGYGSSYNTASTSNGSGVFEFFDNFDTLTNWFSNGATIINGIANINSGQAIDKVFTNLPNNYIVETRYQRPSYNRNRMYLTYVASGSPTGFDYGDFDNLFWNGFSGTTLPINTWLKESWINSNDNYTWKFDTEEGNNLFTRSAGKKFNGLNRIVFASDGWNDNNQMRFDWLSIRQYTPQEPTATITNTETVLGINDTFSTIVTIPTETARYQITATATSTTGLNIATSPNTFVPIRVDLANSFKNISLTSSLEGLNTQTDLTDFLNSNDPSSFNINKLKNLNLNLDVTKGTEAVTIDFAKYNNLYTKNTNDTLDYTSIFRSDGKIALINNTTETISKYNPQNSSNIKKNFYSVLPQSLISDTANFGQILRGLNVQNNCNQDSCNWQYNLVYPYWLSGGIYELRLRAFKGDSFEEQTVAFEINGQTQTTPKLLRTDKKILTDRCEFATKLLATNPSNPTSLGLTGDSLTFAQNCSKIDNQANSEDKIKTVNSANYTGSSGYRYATANSVKTKVTETTGISNDIATGLKGVASIVNADQYQPTTGISQTIYTNSNELKLYLAGEPNKLINFRFKTVNSNTDLTNIIEGKIDPLQPTVDVCKAKLGNSTPDGLCKLYNQLNYNIIRNSEFETKDTGILEKNLSLPNTPIGTDNRYVLTVWSCTIEPATIVNPSYDKTKATTTDPVTNIVTNPATIINPKAGQCTTESPATKYTHYKIVVDKQLPNLEWVNTSVDTKSNPNAVSPWIRSGDTVNFTFKTNEALAIATPTATSNLITQAGYRATLAKIIDNSITTKTSPTTTKPCNQAYTNNQLLNQTSIDLNCSIAYQNSTTQTASFTPLTDIEGSYYTNLYLTDLAGNSTIITNDTTSTTNGNTVVSSTNNSTNTTTPSSTIGSSTNNSSNQSSSTTPIPEVNTLDTYLAGLTTIAKANILNTNTQDIDRTVLAAPVKIDVNFLTDPTKKDLTGNLITTGLTPNQLAILNGVPNTATSSLLGKDTNPIPKDYPYSKVAIKACVYATNSTTPTNLPCNTDIAGNITNSSGTIRNNSLDFRLFVDNTLPDKQQSFDTTNFCMNDGLRADGKQPERDRLSPVNPATANQCSTTNYDGTRFVIRGNTVTLTGTFEKNQRVALKAIKKNKLTPTIEDVKYYFPDSAITGTCTQSPTQTTDKIGRQLLITKFKDICNYTFTYNLNADGTQNNQLDLTNYYDFSYYPMDKAGNVPTPSGVNTSIYSSTLTVYHDKIKPNVILNSPECPSNSSLTNPIANPNGTPNLNNNINLCTSPLTTINYNQQDKIALGTDTTTNQNINNGGKPEITTSPATPETPTNNPITYNQYDTTNQTTLQIKTIGEKLSDLEQRQTQRLNTITSPNTPTATTSYNTPNKIELTSNTTTTTNPNQGILDDNNKLITDLNLLKQIRVQKMGNTGPYSENILIFSLGKATTDEADNCITISNAPIKNRRVGTCGVPNVTAGVPLANNLGGDGLYTIQERNIDTAGNRGSWVSRVVERDTVSPANPNLSITKTNGTYQGVTNPFEEYLNLSISNGEAYTKALITITDYQNSNRYKDATLDANGNLNLNNIWGQKLECGKLTYTVSVRLQDRAGNYSQNVSKTITTGECASCSYTGNGLFINPIQDSASYGKVTSNFLTDRGDHPHAGIDFSVAYNGSVVSVQNGTVDFKGYEAGGWGNYIIIKHILGTSPNTETYYTIYAHLLSTSTKNIGQPVSQGEVIGKGGNIGNVYPLPTPTNPTAGTHLHFQIQKIGAPLLPGMSPATASGRGNVINPSFLLTQIQGNITNTTLIAKYCQGNGTGNSENQEPDYPTINQEQALNSFLNYIRTNLSPNTILESRNDNKSTYIKVSDLSPDNNTAKQQLQNYITYPTGNSNQTAPSGITNNTSGTWILRLGNGNWDSIKVNSTNQSGNKGVIAINTRQQIQNDTQNPNNNIYKAYTVKNGMYEKYQQEGYGSSVIGVPTNEESPARTNNTTPTTRATSAYYQSFERGYKNKKYSNNRIIWGNHPQENDTGNSNSNQTKYIAGEVANKYNETGDVGTYGYPTGNTFGTDGAELCKQYFEQKEINVCMDLTQFRTVTGGDKFRGIGDDADKTERKYNFQIKSNNPDTDKYRYNGTSNVWILSHGWKNNPGSWACKNDNSDFANTIRSKDENAIILCLDWSDAAQENDQIRFGIQLQPDKQASWIGTTANSVIDQLKKWGLDQNTANTKLNVVGHSLGTIMSATISERYNKANYLLAMDPPGGSTGGLGFNINPGNSNFTSFAGKAHFTRSFVVVGTAADDPNHSSTADESFLVYMDGIGSQPELHYKFQDKVKEFLNNQNNFCNIYTSCDYFNTTNKRGNGFPKTNLTTNVTLQQNHSGVILTTGGDDKSLQYLAIKENNNDNMILLGNNQNNTQMSPNLTDLKKDRSYTMYGRGGNDNFDFVNTSPFYNKVGDFGGTPIQGPGVIQPNEGDKITLSLAQATNKYYPLFIPTNQVGDSRNIVRCTVPTTECKEGIVLTLQGSRAGEVSQQSLIDALSNDVDKRNKSAIQLK